MTDWATKNIPDQTGRIAVITGAQSASDMKPPRRRTRRSGGSCGRFPKI